VVDLHVAAGDRRVDGARLRVLGEGLVDGLSYLRHGVGRGSLDVEVEPGASSAFKPCLDSMAVIQNEGVDLTAAEMPHGAAARAVKLALVLAF
jgi:hypothetical protein